MGIKWIFFDIGSTLVDEAEAYDHRAREMLSGTDISFSEFNRKRIELARMGFDGNSAAINYFGLDKTPWHTEDEMLYDDAAVTLSALEQRGYRLGIIANQVAGAKDRLRSFGLLKYFDVVVTSAESGVAKPDRAIFEKALELAGCEAENGVMVGDRLDNDVIPAKAIGMVTVWIRQGLAAYQDTKLGEDKADYIIDKLSELLVLFGKI